MTCKFFFSVEKNKKNSKMHSALVNRQLLTLESL